MTRTRFATLLAAAAVVAIAGCSSDSGDDGSNPPPPPPPGSSQGAMTAKINGASFASVGSSFSYTQNTLAVVGTDLTYTVSVAVGNVTGPGTYTVGATNGSVAIFIVAKSPGSGWDTLGAGGTGTVTITSISETHVAGTFSFTAIPQSGTTGPMVVTQGAFNMTK
jgi:hypothetical protein